MSPPAPSAASPVQVGYIRDSYLEQRNLLKTVPDGFEHVLLENRLDVIPSILSRFGIDTWGRRSWYRYLAIARNVRKVKLLHLFNHLHLGTHPWIVTYETAVPRWSDESQFGMKLLANKHCVAILAMSEVARQLQLRSIERFSKYRRQIEAKMCTLHPPQEVLVENLDRKSVSPDWLDLALIGHEFFRKGGREVLRVLERLIQQGARIRLNIVSKLVHGDYASHATPDDLAIAEQTIRRYPRHIRHWRCLPYQEVLELLRRCHVGLLPTYADTYGFSVLEAQAAGCPVISTNVRALPEINDSRSGWVIELPLSQGSDAHLHKARDRAEVSQLIAAGLEAILKEILDSPESVRIKGQHSLERIRQFHDPQTHSMRLKELYQNALMS